MQSFLDSMDTGPVETDESENSGPFGISKESKRVCVPPTMVNIIFLILCPPLALFLQNGIKGFFHNCMLAINSQGLLFPRSNLCSFAYIVLK